MKYIYVKVDQAGSLKGSSLLKTHSKTSRRWVWWDSGGSVSFQLSSSLFCSSLQQLKGSEWSEPPLALRSTLFDAFCKASEGKELSFPPPPPPPTDPVDAAAARPGRAGASSALRGVPDCTAIVQILNQGSRCNRCFDSQRLFYAVLSFPSSTALFFLTCKKRNGDLLNN